MSKTVTHLHCHIKGRVQGVCYRISTQQKAQQLGINGWVKNLADGRVEVAAKADNTQLQTFIAWLWQGPAMARVDDIEFDNHQIELHDLNTFEIR